MPPATATSRRRKGVGPLGVPRRWVIYRNLAEASQMPPDWHGWMHYMVDTPADRGALHAPALGEGRTAST